MWTYFWLIADKNGTSVSAVMDICIRLLEYIVAEGRGISDEQCLHVNVRNVRCIVDGSLIYFYMNAPLPWKRKNLVRIPSAIRC